MRRSMLLIRHAVHFQSQSPNRYTPLGIQFSVLLISLFSYGSYFDRPKQLQVIPEWSTLQRKTEWANMCGKWFSYWKQYYHLLRSSVLHVTLHEVKILGVAHSITPQPPDPPWLWPWLPQSHLAQCCGETKGNFRNVKSISMDQIWTYDLCA